MDPRICYRPGWDIQNGRRETSSGHSRVPLVTSVQAKQPGSTEVGSDAWPTGPSEAQVQAKVRLSIPVQL